MHEQLIGELATFLRRNGLLEQTLTEHVPGPDGKCSCCKASKYTYIPWPCTTHKAAVVAAQTAPAVRRAG